MTAAAIAAAVGGTVVALVVFIIAIVAMRKAYKLNRASRATYEAAYSTLEAAAGLVADAKMLVDGVTDGSLRA